MAGLSDKILKQISSRIFEGVKKMSPLELSGFIISNISKGIMEASDDIEIKIEKDGVVIRKRKEF